MLVIVDIRRKHLTCAQFIIYSKYIFGITTACTADIYELSNGKLTQGLIPVYYIMGPSFDHI